MRLLRLLWQRLLVVALGVFSVWFIVDVVFRFTDNRMNWILALGVTYALAAYVILPRVIRFGLALMRQGRVPAYTTTGDGLAGDPVNLALFGTLDQLRAAFAELGWQEADPLGVSSSWRMARAFLFSQPYPTAPFSTLYLFGRGQDIGFQKAIGDSPRKRHHVRFWGLDLHQAEETAGSARLWQSRGQPAAGERAIWIGAATRDTGFALTRWSFQITHATDSDANAERDLVIADLQSRQLIGEVKPYDERGDLPAKRVNHYVFDGDVSVAELSARR
ncbi:MAG: LssY C-terminal domain-containing protein [Aestuariivirga sp.]|nr:LssY C-terminal domain-containing protein [Aestuariivirga sp.]